VNQVDDTSARPSRFLRLFLTTLLTTVISVTPLCLMNGVFLSHDVIPKVIVVLASAAILLFVLPLWSDGVQVLWNHSRGRLFLCCAIAQTLSLLLSTIFSVQPALSLVGTVWRRFGAIEQGAVIVIATAAASVAMSGARWRMSLFRAVSVSGAVASVYAIAQYFGIDPFLDPQLYTIQVLGGIVRPPATMGHAIYLASWLAPVCVVAAAQAWNEIDPLWKRVQGCAALLTAAAIFLSGTRGATLGLAGGAVVLAARSPGAARLRRRIAFAAGGLAVLATLLAISPAGANLRHRMSQWKQDLGGPRSGVWGESPQLVREFPVLGGGPETFAGEFRRVESAALSRAYPDFYHETPHNAFVDAATAQGIPGLFILPGVFFAGWMGRARPAGVEAGLEGALVSIFICSLFASFSLVEFLYLWTIAGIYCGSPEGAPVFKAGTAWLQVPATLLGGTMAITAVLLSVPDFMNVEIQDAVDERRPTAAMAASGRAEAWSFGLPGYDLWRSREMATLARHLGNTPEAQAAWQLASEAATAAERSSEERFSAAFQSAVLAIASGNLTRAEQEARASIALAPNWYKPHLLLAQILGAMGRAGDAVSEQRLAAELGAPRE
jgi:O-antigen ligase